VCHTLPILACIWILRAFGLGRGSTSCRRRADSISTGPSPPCVQDSCHSSLLVVYGHRAAGLAPVPETTCLRYSGSLDFLSVFTFIWFRFAWSPQAEATPAAKRRVQVQVHGSSIRTRIAAHVFPGSVAVVWMSEGEATSDHVALTPAVPAVPALAVGVSAVCDSRDGHHHTVEQLNRVRRIPRNVGSEA
jgi:hypothetical protein